MHDFFSMKSNISSAWGSTWHKPTCCVYIQMFTASHRLYLSYHGHDHAKYTSSIETSVKRVCRRSINSAVNREKMQHGCDELFCVEQGCTKGGLAESVEPNSEVAPSPNNSSCTANHGPSKLICHNEHSWPAMRKELVNHLGQLLFWGGGWKEQCSTCVLAWYWDSISSAFFKCLDVLGLPPTREIEKFFSCYWSSQRKNSKITFDIRILFCIVILMQDESCSDGSYRRNFFTKLPRELAREKNTVYFPQYPQKYCVLHR